MKFNFLYSCSGIRCNALVHAISIACLRGMHIESTWFCGKSALHLKDKKQEV